MSNGAHKDQDDLHVLRQHIGALEAKLSSLARENEELRVVAAQSQALLHAITQMHWTTNPDGSSGIECPQWREFTGQSAEEIQGVGWLDAVHPDDRAHAIEAWQGAVAARSLYRVEYRIRRRDGVYHDFLVLGAPWILEDGSIQNWVGCCVDIFEQRQTERALRVGEERFRTITMRLPIAVFEANAEGQNTFTNEHWSAITGLSREEGTGHGWTRIVHPEDVASTQAAWSEMVRAQEQKRPMEFRFCGPNGAIRWVAVKAVPLKNAEGVVERYLGTVNDITDRKRTEDLIREIMEQKEVIETQRQRLVNVSTPLIPISDHILTMPLVGALDPARAEQVLTTLLEGVSRTGAAVAILDITGVAVVDTQVASALLRAAQAVRLLGAEVILSGIRAEVAQTLVGLSADLASIITTSNLKTAINRAMKITAR